MKRKIPRLCKIKNKLARYGLIGISPSATIVCAYGFIYRPHNKCQRCPLDINTMIKERMLYEFDTPPIINTQK